MINRIFAATFALAFLAVVAVPSIHGANVYSQNFEEGIDTNWTGSGAIQPTKGLKAFGFGDYHLWCGNQDAMVLTLVGLSAHTSLTLTFDLAMWDSIDYHDSNLDIFRVSVDGTDLYNNYFGNYCGNPIAVYGNSIGPGTALTPDFTGYYAPNYGRDSFRDSARHVSYTFNHSASTAVIAFQYPNSQGGLDESFGIDNVVVISNGALQPYIRNPDFTPAGGGTLVGISGEVMGGPSGGTVTMQASTDLGQSDPWRDIGSIQLDGSGTASFSTI